MDSEQQAAEYSSAARGWGRFARGDRAGIAPALETMRSSRDETGDRLPFFEALFLCQGVEERVDAPTVPAPDAVGPIWDDLREAVRDGYVSSDPPAAVALRAARPGWDEEDEDVSRLNLARWVEAIGITPFPAPLAKYLPCARPVVKATTFEQPAAPPPRPTLTPEEIVIAEAIARRASHEDHERSDTEAFLRERLLALTGGAPATHDVERLWRVVYKKEPNKNRRRKRLEH